MTKQGLLSVLVLFVVSMLLDFVVHSLLLAADYAALPALMRSASDAQRHFPAMLLAHGVFAIGVTMIYRRGREAGRDWPGQGLRFGLWLAVATVVPNFLIYYAVQPLGLTLVVKQIVYGGLATVLLGVTAAAVNRAPA